MYETYAIRGGAPITQSVGTWTPGSGLEVAKPRLWHRRADLRGTEMRCSSVNYPIVSALIYDDERNLVGAEGYFQVNITKSI